MKIRIAMMIDKNGKWGASGWGTAEQNEDDDMMMDTAAIGMDDYEDPCGQYFIEAEVELPTVKTVIGKVSP